MLFIILWISLAFTTANYWSKKNEMTFGLALIYCLLLTPLIGGIICSLYEQKIVSIKLVKSETETVNHIQILSKKSNTKMELPKDQSVRNAEEQFGKKSHFAKPQKEVVDVLEKEENLEIKKDLNKIDLFDSGIKKTFKENDVRTQSSRIDKNSVAVFQDPDIQVLKKRKHSLETKIDLLSIEKEEIELTINQFEIRYKLELGELILKILQYQSEAAKNRINRDEAKRDYDSFNESFKKAKIQLPSPLTHEQQNELKSIYRKATKICHPDMVEDDLKGKAQKIFVDLKNAYENNDLSRVIEILELLEGGEIGDLQSHNIDSIENLTLQVKKLENLLASLVNEVRRLKASKTYETIVSIGDIEHYFSNKKEQLNNQLYAMKYGKK